MTLIVIRHGQTDYNAQTRFQGRMDIPLNEKGKGQAKRNGQKLLELLGDDKSSFDYVCSPLGRARNTMEIVRGELALATADYRIDERLIEISFGDWEGQTLTDIKAQQPELFKERERSKWTFLPPGESESYASLAERIAPFLDAVDKPTICVCHGGIIRAMLHHWGESESNLAAIRQIPQDKILVVGEDGPRWE